VEPPERLYVAPDGDDTAAGTEGAPLASVVEAASRFSAGGTVIVRGGLYGPQHMDATGTPDHPLVIRAAQGETPIFEGTGARGGLQESAYSRRRHTILSPNAMYSACLVRRSDGRARLDPSSVATLRRVPPRTETCSMIGGADSLSRVSRNAS